MKVKKLIFKLLMVLSLAVISRSAQAAPLFKGVYGYALPYYNNYTDHIAIADIFGDGIKGATETLNMSLLTAQGGKAFFYLAHQPIQRLIKVEVNGSLLDSRDITTWTPNYCYNEVNGWISFKSGLLNASDDVKVYYEWSDRPAVISPERGVPSRTFMTFRNTGPYMFSPIVQSALGLSSEGYGVAATDLNNDGRVDLAVGFGSPGNYVESGLFPNQGGGNFSLTSSCPKLYFSDFNQMYDGLNMGAADVDSDGLMDLWLYGTTNPGDTSVRMGLARNLGGARGPGAGFAPLSTNRYRGLSTVGAGPGIGGERLAFGDYDNDGALDILSNNVSVSRNVMSDGALVIATDFDHDEATDYSVSYKFVALEAPSLELESYHEYLTWPEGGAAYGEDLFVADGLPRSWPGHIYKYSRDDFWTVKSSITLPDACFSGLAAGNNYLYAITFTDKFAPASRSWGLNVYNRSDLTFVSSFTFSNKPNSSAYGQGAAVAVDPAEQYVYVAHYESRSIYKFDAHNVGAGWVQLLSTATQPSAWAPTGVEVDNDGLYVAERMRVYKRSTDLSQADPAVPVQWSGSYNGITLCTDADSGGNIYVSEARSITTLDNNLNYLAVTAPDVPLSSRYFYIGCGGHESVKRHPRFQMKYSDTSAPAQNRLLAKAPEWADLDNDGDLDAIVGTYGVRPGYPTPTTIFENQGVDVNGVPTLVPRWTDPDPMGAYSVAVGDLDNDGRRDLVFTHYYSTAASSARSIAVYLNQGNFNFTKVWTSDEDPNPWYRGTSAPTTGLFSDVMLADFNNDGKLDIAAGFSGGVSKPANLIVFGNFIGPSAPRTVQVTATTKKNGVMMKVISEYSVNSDGTLGKKLKTWIP